MKAFNCSFVLSLFEQFSWDLPLNHIHLSTSSLKTGRSADSLSDVSARISCTVIVIFSPSVGHSSVSCENVAIGGFEERSCADLT